MRDLRLEYSKALSRLDVDRILGLMADDVTIRVAVHDEAMHGGETAPFLSTGRIGDLTVFFRPLPALQLVAEVIGARMAERFGRLEDRPGQ